ncbi:MAG: bacillithiol biosynthesis deacetylase BshB1 [Nitrospinae bacterium]|nr:bacillithiol biosynthesis deacetylase BshB1 [Nitrospinota bacterium]
MIDILCVGCHPDDIEMSMAGSILLFKEKGYRVGILDLTNGEPTPFGAPEKRMEERDRASRILNVDARITLDLPNRYLTENLDAREKIAEVYRELRPSIIFTHYDEDIHPDHTAGSRLSVEARFHAKLTKTSMKGAPHFADLLFYHGANHKRIIQQPAFILDVTTFFEKKLEACRCYESQFYTPERKEYMKDILTGRGLYYGSLIRAKYGEPFFSTEAVGLNDIAHLAGFHPGHLQNSKSLPTRKGMADIEKWVKEGEAF